jgi:hypothetical protein
MSRLQPKQQRRLRGKRGEAAQVIRKTSAVSLAASTPAEKWSESPFPYGSEVAIAPRLRGWWR